MFPRCSADSFDFNNIHFINISFLDQDKMRHHINTWQKSCRLNNHLTTEMAFRRLGDSPTLSRGYLVLKRNHIWSCNDVTLQQSWRLEVANIHDMLWHLYLPLLFIVSLFSWLILPKINTIRPSTKIKHRNEQKQQQWIKDKTKPKSQIRFKTLHHVKGWKMLPCFEISAIPSTGPVATVQRSTEQKPLASAAKWGIGLFCKHISKMNSSVS